MCGFFYSIGYTWNMDYFVIALGNPGDKYKETRHNVGWIVLNRIYDLDWEHDKYLHADYSRRLDAGKTIHYVLPQTFMNKSGESVAGLQKIFSDFDNKHLIVIYDDLDLPLGKVRVSFDRGSGGHNGIKSIEQHLNSKAFIRIRIGIAQEREEIGIIKPPVLGTFELDEQTVILQKVSPLVRSILDTIVVEGYEKAMNIYNGK